MYAWSLSVHTQRFINFQLIHLQMIFCCKNHTQIPISDWIIYFYRNFICVWKKIFGSYEPSEVLILLTIKDHKLMNKLLQDVQCTIVLFWSQTNFLTFDFWNEFSIFLDRILYSIKAKKNMFLLISISPFSSIDIYFDLLA